jgi:hypothetical protein
MARTVAQQSMWFDHVDNFCTRHHGGDLLYYFSESLKLMDVAPMRCTNNFHSLWRHHDFISNSIGNPSTVILKKAHITFKGLLSMRRFKVNQGHSRALKGTRGQSKALKGNQGQSNANKGTQGQSKAFKGNQGHSSMGTQGPPRAIKSTQGHPWALKGLQEQSRALKGNMNYRVLAVAQPG